MHRMARLLRLLAAVSTAAHEIRLELEQGPAYLTFTEGDDLEHIADAFAAKHDLKGGEGCVGRDCVVRMLTSAMRIEMDGGGVGVNRVSVSGVEYRRQGALEVARQAQLSRPPAAVTAEPRHVSAPCAPPFCSFECATNDASVEERVARDFIEDDPELRELMRGYPPPRKCSHSLYPVFIGIPRSEVVDCVPRKYYGFRGGHHSKFGDRAYAFGPHEESEYKRAYRESYFGSTKKKAGWDCMRHYEIVASGAVPFFDEDPTRAPSSTLAFWPKKLLRDLRTWPGVYHKNGTVDVDVLDASGAYGKLAAGLLTYLRERLTTEALARYILETMGQSKARHVLILSAHPAPDFLRESVVHGFRQRLGVEAVDFVKPLHLYEPRVAAPWDLAARSELYGNGFTYAYRLRDDPRVDRSDVVKKLRDHFFDVVVYASVHRGLPYFDVVREHYGYDEIAFVDGEDEHGWSNFSVGLPAVGHYFMRELPDGCPPDIEVGEGFFRGV